MTAEPLLTARQVARLLAIHINTVKRIDRAELPYLRLFSRGDRRYRPEDVAAYLERMR